MPRDFIRGRREPEIPSSTISYFFREALRRIWISKRTSFLAISMIAISLLVVGIFLLVAENLSRAAEEWQGSSRVVVYLDADATPQQIAEVDRFLSSHAELSQRKLVTREEALERFRSWFSNLSDVLGQLDENPFPPSFEIDAGTGAAQSREFHQKMAALRAIEGVDQVQHDWEWVTRLRRVSGVINGIGIVAGGILAIAAAFTIANVIRLTMLLYREEIEIMRLVGATERIIRGPFLIEGLIQGTLGGLVAIAILFGLWELARRTLDPSLSMLWGFLFTAFLPWQKIAALVAGGMLAGWFGSWLSVRGRTGGE
jgi:cell division transport system permease protein